MQKQCKITGFFLFLQMFADFFCLICSKYLPLLGKHYNMSLYLVAFFFLSIAQTVFSVPAERVRRILKIVDGNHVEGVLCGDELGAFYRAANGRMIVKTSRGFESISLTAGTDLHNVMATRRAQMKRVGSVQTAPIKTVGLKYVPVVLVSFADKYFSVVSSHQNLLRYYELFCNGLRNDERYTGHGSRGSIKDYFLEQSMGQFEPEFILIGPVRIDSAYAFYGADSYDGNGKILHLDVKFSLFRNEAISKALSLYSDWSIFDNDADGSVDMVFFPYAGMGQNNGGSEATIWPKEFTAAVTIAGTRFATSAAYCECRPLRRDGQGKVVETKVDGIGVFVHELSHALGLPDFYDTKNVVFGMDMWSVMDYGEYCNNGYNPANGTAYERNFMGWEPLPEIVGPSTLHLGCFAYGEGVLRL